MRREGKYERVSPKTRQGHLREPSMANKSRLSKSGVVYNPR